ncbi:hypothetical protein [Paenibacillus oryzisoli]|uniref:hypothetical protein n=1 Tax=Paenibacillus oryzisoli TaxID=1850517 RepID=UPI000ABCAB18|nr:hypothetical protein [Paenibacillus oryzisoli]
MQAITSPLVGIAGEYSAIPFGIMICTTSVLAIVVYIVLIRKVETVGVVSNT